MVILSTRLIACSPTLLSFLTKGVMLDQISWLADDLKKVSPLHDYLMMGMSFGMMPIE